MSIYKAHRIHTVFFLTLILIGIVAMPRLGAFLKESSMGGVTDSVLVQRPIVTRHCDVTTVCHVNLPETSPSEALLQEALSQALLPEATAHKTLEQKTRSLPARVSLHIEPASMPILHPLQMTVTLKGLKAHQVTLEFSGRDMPMYIEPVLLNGESNDVNQSRYTGTGMISFCSSDKHMVWLARINITTKTEVHTVVFELDTSRSQ